MGRVEQTATNSAHTDANQNFSIIGVIGTAGTADTQGTASTLPIGVDPATGAMYVTPLDATPNINSNNPETNLFYLNTGLLGTVVKNFGTVSYTKQLFYDSNNILGTVTKWV